MQDTVFDHLVARMDHWTFSPSLSFSFVRSLSVRGSHADLCTFGPVLDFPSHVYESLPVLSRKTIGGQPSPFSLFRQHALSVVETLSTFDLGIDIARRKVRVFFFRPRSLSYARATSAVIRRAMRCRVSFFLLLQDFVGSGIDTARYKDSCLARRVIMGIFIDPMEAL